MNRLFLISILLLCGCQATPPRQQTYPAFYENHQGVPEQLQIDLSASRDSVLDQPDDPMTVLLYARAAGALARLEARSWLRPLPVDGSASPLLAQQQTRRYALMSHSCRYALSLFNEYQLLGGKLDWQDQVEQAWLFTLLGNDEEAKRILIDLQFDASLPEHASHELDQIVDQVSKLPPL